MRLPEKKKPGDPVKAEDWNTLIDAINARTPRSGDGLKLICSSGGFAYSSPPEMVTHLKHPPFSVIGIEKSGASYKVTIKEGWVIERQPQSDIHPAVNFLMPTASGTALNATPRPQLTMSPGQTAWCRYESDTQGTITGTPTILISSATNNGTHYSPEDPDESGEPGVFIVKLFRLNVTDGVVSVTPYQQSDIEHWGQLWTGVNMGYGARVFKEYAEDENLYKFRTIKGLGAITTSENGNEIEVSFDGTHPWKVTNAGSGKARVQGGTLYDTLSKKSGGGTGEYWDFVKQPFDKATEPEIEVSGTGYIYVKVEIALTIGDDSRTLYNNPVVYGIPSFDGMPSCQFHFYGDPPAITVFFSTTPPSGIGSGPSSPPLWIIPIAKVSRDGANVVVDSQYLTHNPMLQLAMTHLNAP